MTPQSPFPAEAKQLLYAREELPESFGFVGDREFIEDLSSGQANGDVVTAAANIYAHSQFKRGGLFHKGSFADKMYHPQVSSTYRTTFGTIPVDLENDAGGGGGISSPCEPE